MLVAGLWISARIAKRRVQVLLRKLPRHNVRIRKPYYEDVCAKTLFSGRLQGAIFVSRRARAYLAGASLRTRYWSLKPIHVLPFRSTEGLAVRES